MDELFEMERMRARTPHIPNKVTRVTQMTVAASIPSGQFREAYKRSDGHWYRMTRTTGGRLGWMRVGQPERIAA